MYSGNARSFGRVRDGFWIEGLLRGRVDSSPSFLYIYIYTRKSTILPLGCSVCRPLFAVLCLALSGGAGAIDVATLCFAGPKSLFRGRCAALSTRVVQGELLRNALSLAKIIIRHLPV